MTGLLGFGLCLLAPLLEPLHGGGMERPLYPPLFRLAVCIRVQVVTAFSLWLGFFDCKRGLPRARVRAHSGHLPRDFYIGGVGANREPVAIDFACDHRLRECSYYGQL